MSRIFNITLYLDERLGTVTMLTNEEINGQSIGFNGPEKFVIQHPDEMPLMLSRAANVGVYEIVRKLRNR